MRRKYIDDVHLYVQIVHPRNDSIVTALTPVLSKHHMWFMHNYVKRRYITSHLGREVPGIVFEIDDNMFKDPMSSVTKLIDFLQHILVAMDNYITDAELSEFIVEALGKITKESSTHPNLYLSKVQRDLINKNKPDSERLHLTLFNSYSVTENVQLNIYAARGEIFE